MKSFLKACRSARRIHPIIWDNYGVKARRSIVRYWLPGVQMKIYLPWNA